MQVFHTCWYSCSDGFTNLFFFFSQTYWVAIAAGLNLQCIPSNSTFSCNILTFLCFSGALSASLVTLHMGPMVLFKVYGIALNTVKKYVRIMRDHFLL